MSTNIGPDFTTSPLPTTTKSNNGNHLAFFCLAICPCSSSFYNIKTFTLLLSLLILSSTIITSGFISAIITSLQRQYNMPTSKIGIIMSSFDIMTVFAVPVLSYLGARTNRPRFIASFAFIYAIGTVVFTFPYFFGQRYIVNESDKIRNLTVQPSIYEEYTDLCRLDLNTTIVNRTTECLLESQQVWPYYVFIGGQLLMSLGVAPLFSLGLTYLCDNLEERSHGFYTGFLYGSYALGPALGYVLASLLLSKWVTPWDPNPPKITENDPRWVGLWWAGFLCSSGLTVVFSLCMITFPKYLPQSRHLKDKKKKDKSSGKAADALSVSTTTSAGLTTASSVTFDSIQTVTSNQNQSEFLRKIKGFSRSVLSLILNIDYILIVLAISFESILASGFTTFMVKFTQDIFQVEPSRSSILTGGVVVPSAIVGAILGGFIVKKFNLNLEGCIRLILGASVITILGIVMLLFIRCPGQKSEGINSVNQSYNTTHCTPECNCELSYNPVCGSDGKTYVSPCLIGCRYANRTGYYDCKCNYQSVEAAQFGKCLRKCDTQLILFMSLLFMVILAEGLMMTPSTIILLKIAEKRLQSLSLGLMKCVNNLLAYIPAPIIFSKLIDNTCILWNTKCNDDKGTCLEHNLTWFHDIYLGSALGVKLVSFLIILFAFIHIHRSYVLKERYTRKFTLTSSSNNRTKSQADLKMIASEVALNTTANSIDDSQSLYKNDHRRSNTNRSGLGANANNSVSLNSIRTMTSVFSNSSIDSSLNSKMNSIKEEEHHSISKF